jgi:hypothetical protein
MKTIVHINCDGSSGCPYPLAHKDKETKMKENTTYRLSELTVNADELRRLRDDLDDHLASGLQLWRRIDNLIKQGTIPQKDASDNR